MSLSCVEPEPADGPAVRRVEALAHPGPAGPSPMFADLTTFRVGGEIAHYVEAHSEEELIATVAAADHDGAPLLSLIHISEPTRLGMISYAVFCLKKKKK